MELREYVRILRRGLPIVLVVTLLGTAAAVGLIALTPKMYEAKAQVFVANAASTTSTDSAGNLVKGNTFAQDRVQSYTSLATTTNLTDHVIEDARSNAAKSGVAASSLAKLTPERLAKNIDASAPNNQVTIDLAVRNGDARTATLLTNTLASDFSTFIGCFESPGPLDGSTDTTRNEFCANATLANSPVKLRVVQAAAVPTSPVAPDVVLDLVLGIGIGFLLSLAIVALRVALDNTVKGAADFEKLNVPVLGHVPFDKRVLREPIAFRGDPHSGRAEAYRQLRNNLQFVDIDNPPHLIAVTSAVPGEGKSLTAINLAAALAEAGFRVCLIDADLRRPSVAKKLGLISDVGFTTALISDTPVHEVLQNAGRDLAVLASGAIPPNPSELLLSTHARDIIFDIAAMVDYTIIDTPPLLPVVDGAQLATIAEATIIVARAGKTTKEQSQRAVEALAAVGERPVGVILNMVTRSRGNDEYGYGYYYAPEPTAAPRRRKGKGDDAAASETVEVGETAVPADTSTGEHAAEELPGTDGEAAAPATASSNGHAATDSEVSSLR